jgi:hypothetical protein
LHRIWYEYISVVHVWKVRFRRSRLLLVIPSLLKDTNEDGVFSLSELQQWADSNIIIKLAEDGREKDVDELITKRLEDFNSDKKKKLDDEAEEWKGI